MAISDIVLLEGARTPFGKFGGSLRDISAIDLGTASAKEAINRSGIEPNEIDEVIFGNVIQSSSDAVYLARHVGLKAGVPLESPGLTVNRLCGSGLQSVINGAQSILLKESKLVLAGGAESMSQVPHVVRGARWGLPLGQSSMYDYLWEALHDPYCGFNMAMTAENLAEQYQITREEADLVAMLSQKKALKSIENGYDQKEIVPIYIKETNIEKVIDRDEHPRDTDMESLSKLRPIFKIDGIVTAGNASGINDGAAAVVLASSQYAEQKNLKPIGRLVSWAVVGVDPSKMGIGPVPAIQKALSKANMKLGQLDLIEINEAFAAQYLACQKLLDYDPEIGNVNGGAISYGHPLGASGTRIILSMLYELGRRGKKYGATALCIGGGQGIAAIWERF